MSTRKTIKILFWCVAGPVMFAVFMRLFFILFRFVYGTLVILIFGESVENLVVIMSAVTALFFTIGVIHYVYRQLKNHIIEE